MTIDGDSHDDIFVFRVFFENKVEEGEAERDLLYNVTNLEYETGIAKTSMQPYKAESIFSFMLFCFFSFFFINSIIVILSFFFKKYLLKNF